MQYDLGIVYPPPTFCQLFVQSQIPRCKKCVVGGCLKLRQVVVNPEPMVATHGFVSERFGEQSSNLLRFLSVHAGLIKALAVSGRAEVFFLAVKAS